MHTTLDRENFLWALDLVSKISTKHQTLPVLQCVVLDTSTKKNTLILKATNLELGIEVAIPCATKEGSIIAVPVEVLYQTTNLLLEKEIHLSQKDTILNIETKTAKTEIKTLSHEEFPPIPTLTTKTQTINGKMFAEGLKTTLFAVSQSSIKPELGSVYIHQKKEHTLTFTATDSFRLAEKTVPQKSVGLEHPLLIPSKNAQELARITEYIGEDPQLQTTENQCALTFNTTTKNNVYVTSRLTDGQFPDYKQIIPKEFVTHTTVLCADIIHALKKTNIFTNKFLQVGVDIQAKKNTITFLSDNNDLGTTTESVKADIDGEDLTLSFNQRYLIEALQYFHDESITLHFAGVGRPTVAVGVHNQSFRYLVMPMNK